MAGAKKKAMNRTNKKTVAKRNVGGMNKAKKMAMKRMRGGGVQKKR